jgi:uncharacterized protein YndB with AHSA1/START domain
MADVVQELPINATRQRVFDAVSSPAGLATWWAKGASGAPVEGTEYELDFGPEYQWRARVTRAIPDTEFELELTNADADWTGTRVGFRLTGEGAKTRLEFRHTGWPADNRHYRVSCHCWAMYLRILRRHLEHGEVVPYEERLDA